MMGLQSEIRFKAPAQNISGSPAGMSVSVRLLGVRISGVAGGVEVYVSSRGVTAGKGGAGGAVS